MMPEGLNKMCWDCQLFENRECVGTANLIYSGCIYRVERRRSNENELKGGKNKRRI